MPTGISIIFVSICLNVSTNELRGLKNKNVWYIILTSTHFKEAAALYQKDKVQNKRPFSSFSRSRPFYASKSRFKPSILFKDQSTPIPIPAVVGANENSFSELEYEGADLRSQIFAEQHMRVLSALKRPKTHRELNINSLFILYWLKFTKKF